MVCEDIRRVFAPALHPRLFRCGLSWAQRRYRTDNDAVLMLVCVVADCGENHPERRWLHSGGVDLAGKPSKRINTLLYQLSPAKLYFHKAVVAVLIRHDGIALQSVSVEIMADISPCRIRVNAQIAYGQRFKHNPKGDFDAISRETLTTSHGRL